MKEISFTKMHFNLVQFGIKDNHEPNNGEKISVLHSFHCVKSVRIRGYSGLHFPAFGLNTERYGVSECGKIRTRITPNADTFYAVKGNHEFDSGKKHRLSYFCIFFNPCFNSFPPQKNLV